jgi:pantothenate kinase
MLQFRLYSVIKKSLCTWGALENSVYSNNRHNINDLKMTITEYIRNMYRAVLNTVFENTVRRVNKWMETGGGHFKLYL